VWAVSRELGGAKYGPGDEESAVGCRRHRRTARGIREVETSWAIGDAMPSWSSVGVPGGSSVTGETATAWCKGQAPRGMPGST
jgi:hypothetical protein